MIAGCRPRVAGQAFGSAEASSASSCSPSSSPPLFAGGLDGFVAVVGAGSVGTGAVRGGWVAVGGGAVAVSDGRVVVCDVVLGGGSVVEPVVCATVGGCVAVGS